MYFQSLRTLRLAQNIKQLYNNHESYLQLFFIYFVLKYPDDLCPYEGGFHNEYHLYLFVLHPKVNVNNIQYNYIILIRNTKQYRLFNTSHNYS